MTQLEAYGIQVCNYSAMYKLLLSAVDYLSVHIEAEEICPTFPSRLFQMDFLEWKCLNFG